MSKLFSPETTEMSKKFDENYKWFIENYEKIKKDFADKIVAIDHNNIVESDDDLKSIISKLKQNYNDIRHIVIQYINKENYVTLI
jgi:hypothetical protein